MLSTRPVLIEDSVIPVRSEESVLPVHLENATLFDGKVQLPDGIEAARSSYASAKPFPHVVIDNLFAAELLEPMLTEIAGMERAKWKKVENDTRERTVRMRSALELGPAGTHLLSIAHSANFLYLLSEISGISQLIPDPYLQGAGYAIMRRGDYFHVHA